MIKSKKKITAVMVATFFLFTLGVVGLAQRHLMVLAPRPEVKVELAAAPRDPHQLEITVDGARAAVEALTAAESGVAPRTVFEFPLTLTAGPKLVGVSFVQRTEARDEATLRPRTRSRGTQPAIASVTISGPHAATGPGDSPSRRRIFVCRPAAKTDEARCATQIFSTLARRAYRRPTTDEDTQTLLGFFESARTDGGFDAGVRAGLERLLVSPDFLFRIEADPDRIAPGAAYRLSDVELASRLSFFLWSSIPDDELLDLGIRDRLRDPRVLDQQVRRMLADPRARAALVDNFFGQWLQTRNVWLLTPDVNRKYPWFDDNLRSAFVKETELFLDDQLKTDRSIGELLTANETFLNEQLARHYGVPGVYGSHFRRVRLADENRWGLLGKASILAVTSYPDRTAPTIRGKWLLENILAAPPPPPPPNANTTLAENKTGRPVSVREMLERHRANPVCSSCHARMDPLGFSLENFDALGQWRTMDGDTPVNATGVLLDGTPVDGPAALRRALVAQNEQFVRTVTGKLLTYALGREMTSSDAPTIRSIVRAAAPDDYRWSSMILAIVKSTPFQMRRARS